MPIDGLQTDETIRPETTLEALAGLKPAFESPDMAERFPQIDWRVTAGNASPVNDGSAALLMTTPEIARELGLEPKARLHTFAVVGDDPIAMLTGVIPATARVLDRAGLRIDDIDLFEVNEAFARSSSPGSARPAPTWTRSTSTAAPSRSATRSAPAARGS